MANNKNFHDRAFDEGTKCKLELYRQYLRAWIPTFLNNPWIKSIQIFDFFAGPGTDGTGNAGSPVLAAEELKLAIDKYCEKQALDKTIKLYLNELDSNKFHLLQKTTEQIRAQVPSVSVIATMESFSSLLQQYLSCMQAQKTANFIFIDKFGLKEVNEDIFRTITSLSHTDFMFYLAAATANRFKDLADVVKYLPPLTDEDRQSMNGDNVLRILAESYNRNWAPAGYFLGRYSIKKGANVYGLIFGSHHPAGIEKFLQEAWKMGGDANFDIDHDNIDANQPSLFPENDIPSRIKEFQQALISYLKTRPQMTDRRLYLIAIRNGMLSSHVRSVVNKLKADGFILNKKVNVSYSNWAGKQPSVTLEYAEEERKCE